MNSIPGLEFITKLQPVTFTYNLDKQYELTGQKITSTNPYERDIEKITFSGFMAQDVEETANKIGYDFSGIDKSGTIWGLRYSDFIPSMVKSIQELNQQNKQLKEENKRLLNSIKIIEQKLSGK